MSTILLSDGQPFEVRRLGLFELDDITPEPLPNITYEIEIAGKVEVDEFDPDLFPEPPEKPDIEESEIVKFSRAYYDLQNYKLYQAAMYRKKQQTQALNDFYEVVGQYILNACVDDTDRIVTSEDWDKVLEAALVPQLTIELITKTLSNTYKAKFKGQNIFDALNETKKGHGSYDVIRLWENKLMVDMRMSEVEYGLMPLAERARKIVASFLPEVMSHLEIEASQKTTAR